MDAVFLRLDPAPWWRSLEGPVLALFGDRDLQVSAAENAPLLETILVGKDQHIETMEGLNH